jgi:hypothetical protein
MLCTAIILNLTQQEASLQHMLPVGLNSILAILAKCPCSLDFKEYHTDTEKNIETQHECKPRQGYKRSGRKEESESRRCENYYILTNKAVPVISHQLSYFIKRAMHMIDKGQPRKKKKKTQSIATDDNFLKMNFLAKKCPSHVSRM